MTTLKIDASPGRKSKGIPAGLEERKAYYEKLIEIYAAQNPVMFAAKKADLEKKRDCFQYIGGKWVNIFDPKTVKEEIKLTTTQKEQAAEQEKVQRVAELEARNKELEEKLGALEVEKEAKPKGRPKK